MANFKKGDIVVTEDCRKWQVVERTWRDDDPELVYVLAQYPCTMKVVKAHEIKGFNADDPALVE